MCLAFAGKFLWEIPTKESIFLADKLRASRMFQLRAVSSVKVLAFWANVSYLLCLLIEPKLQRHSLQPPSRSVFVSKKEGPKKNRWLVIGLSLFSLSRFSEIAVCVAASFQTQLWSTLLPVLWKAFSESSADPMTPWKRRKTAPWNPETSYSCGIESWIPTTNPQWQRTWELLHFLSPCVLLHPRVFFVMAPRKPMKFFHFCWSSQVNPQANYHCCCFACLPHFSA